MFMQIASHIPLWVYALFFYLVYVGVQRLRPSVRDLRRMFVVPAIFIIWGLVGLFTRSGDFSHVLACWVLGAIVGVAIGYSLPQPMRVDRRAQRVAVPGSVIPLVRNLGIFVAHLGLNIAAAIFVSAHAQSITCDIVVSGLSFGYFAGWLWRFVRSYRVAPDFNSIDSGAAAAALS